ncbi:DUF3880 domain-containing protein [Desulfonatronum sp. SC1]|uniref:glycosyltransferase family protein n=1 Tax=Desulfonatronum sp. SC1 TaxID=2109626 RepID=UPI000D321E4E|nr:DUF3880 domain-containing protein [Desulfonatronum sp. SC1]PTN34130.1 glycosyl transferase family 1 [Desulfonatronum sp. SC1]
MTGKPTEARKNRPQRIQVLDQFGRRKSLPDNPEQYQLLHAGDGAENPGVLLLGIGPDPTVAVDMLRGRGDVAYLECPELQRQIQHQAPSGHRAALPSHWRAVSLEDLDDPELTARTILFYGPGLTLFPDFWSPVLALAALRRLPPPTVQDKAVVWLPSSEHRLLTRELSRAFTSQGLTVRFVPESMSPRETLERLREQRPNLFFSVNFQGLDPLGQNHALLRQAGIQVCVWCVDNPFHLLSGLRSAYWKQCRLFVTDDWFIPRLLDHGATRVFHLPLAAAEHFLNQETPPAPRGDWFDLRRRIVFVGRSAFPGKKRFFAGCVVPEDLELTATAFMAQGGRPDFSWWWQQLRFPVLWPGQAVRQVGFAAEEFSRRRRAAYLQAAGGDGNLTVFGDTGWNDLLEESDVRPEVDYYGPLVQIYRQARFTLNLTSLLLPHGLTQRNFDVWAAGGFLLTDLTPGLEIFDPELVQEVAFATPASLHALIRRLDKDSSLIEDLGRAWRDHILKKHLYAQRIVTVLEAATSREARAFLPS